MKKRKPASCLVGILMKLASRTMMARLEKIENMSSLVRTQATPFSLVIKGSFWEMMMTRVKESTATRMRQKKQLTTEAMADIFAEEAEEQRSLNSWQAALISLWQVLDMLVHLKRAN